MLPLSLSPGQQLLQGYFLPCLAWRQPRGPSELRGWQGHRCHLPYNLLRPANAKPGTQHWGHCHGPLHWQNGMAEMFEICALFLLSYAFIKQNPSAVGWCGAAFWKPFQQKCTFLSRNKQLTLFDKSYPLRPCALLSLWFLLYSFQESPLSHLNCFSSPRGQ